MRPSGGIFRSEGMVATCPRFDSPSFFTRDIEEATKLVRHWYGDKLPEKPEKSEKPWAILWPQDFLPVGNAEQMRAIGDFTKDLAKQLRIEPETVSVAGLWDKNKPSEAKGQPLHEYLANVSHHTTQQGSMLICPAPGTRLLLGRLPRVRRLPCASSKDIWLPSIRDRGRAMDVVSHSAILTLRAC